MKFIFSLVTFFFSSLALAQAGEINTDLPHLINAHSALEISTLNSGCISATKDGKTISCQFHLRRLETPSFNAADIEKNTLAEMKKFPPAQREQTNEFFKRNNCKKISEDQIPLKESAKKLGENKNLSYYDEFQSVACSKDLSKIENQAKIFSIFDKRKARTCVTTDKTFETEFTKKSDSLWVSESTENFKGCSLKKTETLSFDKSLVGASPSPWVYRSVVSTVDKNKKECQNITLKSDVIFSAKYESVRQMPAVCEFIEMNIGG